MIVVRPFIQNWRVNLALLVLYVFDLYCFYSSKYINYLKTYILHTHMMLQKNELEIVKQFISTYPISLTQIFEIFLGGVILVI